MSEDKKVKLSPETIAILKKLSKVNQTLKIVAGNNQLTSKRSDNSLIAYIPIEETLPRDLCIYDINEFINVINIVNEPIVDFSNDKYVLIRSSDNTQKVRYVDSSPDVIDSYIDKQVVLPSEDVVLSVTGAQLKSVVSAANTMKLPFVGFVGDGDKIIFTAFNINNGSEEETNSYSVEVGETVDRFKLFFKTEAFNILDGDSTFKISQKCISIVNNGIAKYAIGLDVKSTFAKG